MIEWNEEKAQKLYSERNIDICEVADLIEHDDIIDIIAVPSQENHPGQRMFIIRLHGYICCVPFVIKENGNIFIKTVFPSRRLNAKYGKGDE